MRQDFKSIDQVGEELGEAFAAMPPEHAPRERKSAPKTWQPRLGRIGTEVLMTRDVDAKFLYGERGSLKTGICLHDLILHCYQDYEPGAVTPLAVICTIVRSSATEGGAWEKLHTQYLPEWLDGIGLDFSEPKQDDQKQRWCFIGTKFGQWSRVILKSIPHEQSIRGRVKGIEPSLFFFDEITEADDPDYYLIPSQSLRRPTRGPRFFISAGNPPPTATEHWTWKTMCQKDDGVGADGRKQFKDAVVPNGGGRLQGTPDGVAVWHVPLSENVYWSDKEKTAYRNKLMQEARLDPTAEDRLIKGIWTPRPTGQGLFKQYFVPQIHIKPPDGHVRGKGLLPMAGHPIYVGYDLGQVYSSVRFLQRFPVKDKRVWTCFDEVDHLNERIIYRNLAREIMRRMRHWRTIPLPSNNGQAYPFNYAHITDESAVNQWRPNGEGSFDAWEFEREYNKFSAAEGLPRMKLIGCPKPSGSVAIRVALVQSKLFHEELFISAQCANTKGMLLNLEAEKEDAEKPKRSKWVHVFDSLTYPIFKVEISDGRLPGLSTGSVSGAGIIRCGSS